MQSMPEGDRGQLDADWRGLLDKYDALDAAALIAWTALVDAYKSNANGDIVPTAELLATYEMAKAMRVAAEQALLSFMQQRGVGPPFIG